MADQTAYMGSDYEDAPSIEDVRALQARIGRRDQHVVWLGEHGFVIAHTDEERATIALDECELHQQLVLADRPPVDEPGYYLYVPRTGTDDQARYARIDVEAGPETWSSAIPPGGMVCAAPDPWQPDGICGVPVESEPCGQHAVSPEPAETAGQYRRESPLATAIDVDESWRPGEGGVMETAP